MVDAIYYKQVLEITKDYLGPAADRFVHRQIRSYLKKSPDELQKDDLPMLAIRIRSGLVVLTRDKDIVEQAYKRLTSIN